MSATSVVGARRRTGDAGVVEEKAAGDMEEDGRCLGALERGG
jgi:hypothetical protein